jgi:hypothetical protein
MRPAQIGPRWLPWGVKHGIQELPLMLAQSRQVDAGEHRGNQRIARDAQVEVIDN